MSDKAESEKVNVEENNPEVVHDQRRFLEDKNEEKFEDDDGVEDEESLKEKHLPEHRLEVAVGDAVEVGARRELDPPWKEKN